MKDCLFKPLDKMAFWIQDDFRKKNKIIQVLLELRSSEISQMLIIPALFKLICALFITFEIQQDRAEYNSS